MIRGYSDHAANERTFLAWLRTSIAVIAFGFVVEKLNLFALTAVSAHPLMKKVDRSSRNCRDRLGEVLATPSLWSGIFSS